MSTLPGNPHADVLNAHRDRGNTLTPTVEATLALAYEQRTANLIALANANPAWIASASKTWVRDIDTRMGFKP